MKRTILTAEDIKNIWQGIFNGTDIPERQADGSIVTRRDNPNSETILLVNEDGERENIDLAEYLGIKFYTWKERLVETKDEGGGAAPYSAFDDWVRSIEFSLSQAYALVELVDEEVTTSQDIDNAVKAGRITFLIQSDKVKNLDYYVTKIRNNYIGNPEQIMNAYGDTVTAYLLLGTLMYDEEPATTQYGECVRVSAGFKISYMSDALNYSDQRIEISLDGDDEYDAEGNVVGESKFLTVPITKQSWQAIFTSNAIPTSERPDLTGFLATTLSVVKTFTFFDFNKTLTQRLNEIFWRCGAYRVDGIVSEAQDVNIPVYVRVTTAEHSYVFKDMIDNIQKVITNSDFNVSSLTLKGWGRLGWEISPPPTPQTYSVKYSVCDSGRGVILGNTEQTVVSGGNATSVTAFPLNGWEFSEWSDGRLGATRQDVNVTGDIDVCAMFVKSVPEPVEETATFPYTGIVFDVTTVQMQVAPEPYGKSSPLNPDEAERLEWIDVTLAGTPLENAVIEEILLVQMKGFKWNDDAVTDNAVDWKIEGGVLKVKFAPVPDIDDPLNRVNWERFQNQTSAGDGVYEYRRSTVTVTYTTNP